MMNLEGRHAHWEQVYIEKGEKEVSWFEASPTPSLELIEAAQATPASAIVDIGGGASRLVDALVDQGFQNVTVLDISERALVAAKNRLGERARAVHWVMSDVTTWSPDEAAFDIWHDRAAFSFPDRPERPRRLRCADGEGYQTARACDCRHLCARRAGTVQRLARRALRRANFAGSDRPRIRAPRDPAPSA